VAQQATPEAGQAGRGSQDAGKVGLSKDGQAHGLSDELLKADIQQLLKELSEELRELQSQLADQKSDRSNPLPGTSTDPDLYGETTPLAHAGGRELPITLGVDEQLTSKPRKGTGVGTPSGDVGTLQPQQQPEQAVLSEELAPEAATSRQPIPPEYRSVFERLLGPHEEL